MFTRRVQHHNAVQQTGEPVMIRNAALGLVLLVAGLTAAEASDRRKPGEYWESSRIFSIKDPSGRMQTGSWQVMERTRDRCQFAAQRAERNIALQYPGWKVTGTKRKSPCRRVMTRSSPG